MSKRAIVTIVTRNYLPYARALMRQCERHEPGADRFVVIVDRLPPGAVADIPHARIIHGEDLGIDRWPRYSFQYTPFELSCALKPHAIDHLMTREGYREIVYLDGDMGLYGPLTPVWEAFERHAILLTPHLLRPLPDDGLKPNESLVMNAGPFNAGFIGVGDTADGRAFVGWWKRMLEKRCVNDLLAGMFVDQKWLCLVPGMFRDVGILRHAGINAGHWTLAHATVSCRPTGAFSTADVYVDEDPVVLFHFSNMTPHRPTAYRTILTRARVDEIPCLQALVERFHQDLRASGDEECAGWGCSMDALSDGTPIKSAWREAVRRDEPAVADVENPFDVAARPDLKVRYRAVESIAHQWRHEWQLAWHRERGVRAFLRRMSLRLRNAARILARIARRSAPAVGRPTNTGPHG